MVSQVSAILSEVQLRGDLALIEYTRRFDHADLSPQELAVTEAEIETAAGLIKPELVDALQASHRNVQDFAFRSLRGDWVVKNEQGAEVGERFDPLRRVGIYVPAGTAPLVSTAIMTVSLARAAGVSNIVVTSPVGPDKAMNPGAPDRSPDSRARPRFTRLAALKQSQRWPLALSRSSLSARSSAQETPTSQRPRDKFLVLLQST